MSEVKTSECAVYKVFCGIVPRYYMRECLNMRQPSGECRSLVMGKYIAGSQCSLCKSSKCKSWSSILLFGVSLGNIQPQA